MAKRILIIEDDPDLVKIIEYRLTSQGYEVLVARDGYAGLMMAKRERPDLITLDLNLPELNGFTVCSMIKGNRSYRDIPIIMLTARDGFADRVFDDKMKPEFYMTKPFEVDDLLAKVHELVHDDRKK